MFNSYLSEHRNIRVAYLLAFFSELYFPIAVWIFYYLRYMDFKQIALITAIQVIVSIAFEIPTGAFADIVGRKMAAFLSFFLYAVAMFGAAFANVFWMFAVLEIIKGISIALYNGSVEALVYDTLKEKGEESHYDKVNSNLRSFEWTALFLSAVIGGFMYSLNFRSPYVSQGILYVGSTFLCLLLVEPKIVSQKYSFSAYLKQNLNGFRELFQNFRVSQISLIFITISMGYFVTASFLGISQGKQYGLDSRGVGILFGVGYILSALASQTYPKLKVKFGTSKLALATGSTLLGSLLIANFVGATIGGLLIVSRIVSSSIFNNLRSSVVNSLVGSQNRATTISTMTLLYKIPYALLAYGMGSYIDKQSPNSFAWLLGVVIFVSLLIQLVAWSFRSRLVVIFANGHND